MSQTKKVLDRKEVEALTGTIQGKRFVMKLDDLKIGDKWTPNILPLLQADGIGRTVLDDGVTSFAFTDVNKSIVTFTPDKGNLVISKFSIQEIVEVA